MKLIDMVELLHLNQPIETKMEFCNKIDNEGYFTEVDNEKKHN